jgi:hypothetical protein
MRLWAVIGGMVVALLVVVISKLSKNPRALPGGNRMLVNPGVVVSLPEPNRSYKKQIVAL